MADLDKLTEAYRMLIEALGEDPERPGLKATPARAARALAHLTRGYQQTADEVVNQATFESDNDEMILVRNIEVYSLCEHHLLPFIGRCHIAYLPGERVIGLSKIARLVDVFAARLQIQENLTEQIAEAVSRASGASGVGVVLEAKHMCMMMRGVEKQNSTMTTSMMLGRFRQDARTRGEFLNLIRAPDSGIV